MNASFNDELVLELSQYNAWTVHYWWTGLDEATRNGMRRSFLAADSAEPDRFALQLIAVHSVTPGGLARAIQATQEILGIERLEAAKFFDPMQIAMRLFPVILARNLTKDAARDLATRLHRQGAIITGFLPHYPDPTWNNDSSWSRVPILVYKDKAGEPTSYLSIQDPQPTNLDKDVWQFLVNCSEDHVHVDAAEGATHAEILKGLLGMIERYEVVRPGAIVSIHPEFRDEILAKAPFLLEPPKAREPEQEAKADRGSPHSPPAKKRKPSLKAPRKPRKVRAS